MKAWTCQIVNESMPSSNSSNPSRRAHQGTGHISLLPSAGMNYIIAAVSTTEAIVSDLRGSRVEPTADSSTSFNQSMKLTTFTESFILFFFDLMT